MNVGSCESSSSARRRVRTAWLCAPSETTTSLQTLSKISRRWTAWPRRCSSSTSRSKYRGISGTSSPPRSNWRRAGETTKSAKRKRTGDNRLRVQRLQAARGEHLRLLGAHEGDEAAAQRVLQDARGVGVHGPAGHDSVFGQQVARDRVGGVRAQGRGQDR